MRHNACQCIGVGMGQFQQLGIICSSLTLHGNLSLPQKNTRWKGPPPLPQLDWQQEPYLWLMAIDSDLEATTINPSAGL